jgi:hypothetical protein
LVLSIETAMLLSGVEVAEREWPSVAVDVCDGVIAIVWSSLSREYIIDNF